MAISARRVGGAEVRPDRDRRGSAPDARGFGVHRLRAHWRPGRYGPQFGETVHRAIERVVRSRAPDASTAVAHAARVTELDHHIDEAVADVERAVAALRAERWLEDPRVVFRVRRYPIAGSLAPEALLAGYIDLFGTHAGRDRRRRLQDGPGAVRRRGGPAYPSYAEQVATYARLLACRPLASTKADAPRAALLFTHDGTLRWVRHERA